MDSVAGPAVFYRLDNLKVGNRVIVKLKDGKTVYFSVIGLREYLKSRFPDRFVYGSRPVQRAPARHVRRGVRLADGPLPLEHRRLHEAGQGVAESSTKAPRCPDRRVSRFPLAGVDGLASMRAVSHVGSSCPRRVPAMSWARQSARLREREWPSDGRRAVAIDCSASAKFCRVISGDVLAHRWCSVRLDIGVHADRSSRVVDLHWRSRVGSEYGSLMLNTLCASRS